MTWPFNSSPKNDEDESLTESITTTLTDSRVLIASAALTLTTLGGVRVYKRFLRRVRSVEHIKPDFRTQTLFGKCTSVGDGDNFRFYHTPGGRLAGWGLWRNAPSTKEELKNQTLHIRLSGIDAPEMAHFGKPAQPYSKDALDFLTDYVLGRRVRVRLWRKDQYGRVVGTAHVRKGLFRRDVSLAMLKAGMATVYEAKFGSEFGGQEQVYREAEEKAKKNRVGLWKEERSVWDRLMGKQEYKESPREYKNRMK